MLGACSVCPAAVVADVQLQWLQEECPATPLATLHVELGRRWWLWCCTQTDGSYKIMCISEGIRKKIPSWGPGW